MNTTPLGRFVWYQLNATDLDAARSFYTEMLGWETDVWQGGDGAPYTMFVCAGRPIGGLMELPDEARAAGAPQHWLSYISTPDVDRTVMQARDLDAQVLVPPTDLPEVGRFAVLADPQGAAFAVYTPQDGAEDAPFEPRLGEGSWHELMTTDIDAAAAFYFPLFEWQKNDDMDMGEFGIYRTFQRGGSEIGGMFDKSPDVPAPPNWLVYFRVRDVNERIEAIRKAGGEILNGPMEVPGGDLIAQCLDPQGGAFAIHATAS